MTKSQYDDASEKLLADISALLAVDLGRLDISLNEISAEEKAKRAQQHRSGSSFEEEVEAELLIVASSEAEVAEREKPSADAAMQFYSYGAGRLAYELLLPVTKVQYPGAPLPSDEIDHVTGLLWAIPVLAVMLLMVRCASKCCKEQHDPTSELYDMNARDGEDFVSDQCSDEPAYAPSWRARELAHALAAGGVEAEAGAAVKSSCCFGPSAFSFMPKPSSERAKLMPSSRGL